jgi:hypothetical protein
MCHSLICFMSQNNQSFSCCLSHASLKCPPRCGELDHLANAISRRPLVDHHTYTPKVRVLTKHHQGSNEERGLAIAQRREHCPQSPREVANILTIAMGLRRHSIPTRQCKNVLPRCQLPRHLDKRM